MFSGNNILTNSLKIDIPIVVFIFPLMHAINSESTAFDKSGNNNC